MFGGRSLQSYEMLYQSERLLDRGWPRLELIVFDISLDPEPSFKTHNRFGPRLIQWHDLASIAWIYRMYQRLDIPWPKRRELLAAHLAHLPLHYFRVGDGLIWLDWLQPLERISAWLAGREGGKGSFYTRSATKLEDAVRRRRPDEAPELPQEALNRDRYRAIGLRALRARKNLEQRSGCSSRTGLAEDLRRLARSRGVEAYFTLAPIWRLVDPPTSTIDDPFVVFDFADPERFPVLYDPQMRGGGSHLNVIGARQYSLLLADVIHEQRQIESSRRGRSPEE